MPYDIEAIRRENDLPTIAGHYGPLVKKGNEHAGCCMVHGGDNPGAFTIYTKDGVQRWKCFTQSCESEGDAGNDVIGFIMAVERKSFTEACEFLGGKHEWKPRISKPAKPAQQPRVTTKPPADAPRPNMRWRFGDRSKSPPWVEPESVREFRDMDGALLGYEARYPRGCDPDAPDKSPSRMWTWGAYPGYEPAWGCGHFSRGEVGRPLYGLNRLAEKDKGRASDDPIPVCVTEGPKKADAAAAILDGYACVSWSSGATNWKKHDWTHLRGRKILLWPDNDEPGITAMKQLGMMLRDPKGLACE